jgi:GDP-L-fucose synthase
MEKDKRILVTGHRGMVGRAFMQTLAEAGYSVVLSASRTEYDLALREHVQRLFEQLKPDYVFHFAAKVGGIKANRDHPADFLIENLKIQNNVIEQCHRSRVSKLLFLGSSCIYPRDCPQPMREEYLLTGPLEPTNEGYAIAKIAGLRLVQYFHKQHGLQGINPMPCNLYGPNDSFDFDRSHVLSALVRRFVDARDTGKSAVTLWGTGSARREFMHVNDLANALLFLMHRYESSEIINVGTGEDVSIRELAELIADIVGYDGTIDWDTTMPDGMPRKCLDVTRLRKLGYKHRIGLRAGVEGVTAEYRSLKAKGVYQ